MISDLVGAYGGDHAQDNVLVEWLAIFCIAVGKPTNQIEVINILGLFISYQE